MPNIPRHSIQYNIDGVLPIRHNDGRVVSQFHLSNNTGEKYTIEYPYNSDYHTNLNNSTVRGTPVTGGMIELNFNQVSELFSLNSTGLCPFCKTILINLLEDTNSDLYCFNPTCGPDPKERLYFITYRLNIPLTSDELDLCFDLLAYKDPRTISLLGILELLHNLNISNPITNNIAISVYEKLKYTVINATVSDFLKIIGIPEIYDDELMLFDVVFDNINEFCFEMHNYRAMSTKLPTYNPNLMNLIYTNLQVNKWYIDLFFSLQIKLLK